MDIWKKFPETQFNRNQQTVSTLHPIVLSELPETLLFSEAYLTTELSQLV